MKRNIKQCGLFNFMAHNLGAKVLHPGGITSTEKLLSQISLSEDSSVLDLACGTGSSSFRIYDRFKCKVKGIDLSEDLISIAKKDLKKRKTKGKVSFETGDALKLPFPDNNFDAVISQAFFILIDQQEEALREMVRVLKPGGYLGSIELSWLKEPAKEAKKELKAKTCNVFIPRVKMIDHWNDFFCSNNLEAKALGKYKMESGMFRMIRTEGIVNFLVIMKNMMKSTPTRKKMMDVQRTFRKYDEFLGYGIFSYLKNN